MQAHMGTIMCKFGRHPTICLREEAIFVPGTKVPVSRDLIDLNLQHNLDARTCRPSCASLVAIVEAICAKKFTDTQTHTHTDKQTTDAARLY